MKSTPCAIATSGVCRLSLASRVVEGDQQLGRWIGVKT
jgi:hypothetical protein